MRLTTRLRRPAGDDGFSMILVVCITAAVLGLVTLTAASGIKALRSSANHSSFETALSTAESGIDRTLSEISVAFNSSPSVVDYTSAAPCNVAPPTSAQVATREAEQAWARAALLAMPVSCTRSTGSGDYVAVRPEGRQAVYAMGWHPSRTAPRAKQRLLKAEYLFAPYKPSNALLTASSVDLSGSVAITSPSASIPADVHSNSSIVGYNNSLQVDGRVSASGTLPGACPSGVTGGCVPAAPRQDLPVISARSVYNQDSPGNTQWWDLCPNGQVTLPAATPCAGSVVGGNGFNGWQFTAGSGSTAPRWVLPRTAGGPFPGTYYAFQGDAQIGDNGNSSTLWPITVIAEAKTTGVTNAATCNKLGGNIEWKLFNLTPKLPGLQLLAEANLTGDANSSAGSGLFLAGDKVDLQTSSSTLTGAVIAANKCAAQGGNVVQGITLNYDDSTESTVKDVIRTTLWLEYQAG